MSRRPADEVVLRIASRLAAAGLSDLVTIEACVMQDDGDLPWLEHPDVVWIDEFGSSERRRGHGRTAMAELCLLADEFDCRLALNPWAGDEPGALRQDELEAFYLSMGFGWRHDHVMVREAWAQTVVHVSHDVAYQPKPNRAETILSDTQPPRRLTSTGFAIPVAGDGSALLSKSRKPNRDLEISGGHIETGENDERAARRETDEETGAQVGVLVPIGHQRLVSKGVAPEGWKYPFPLAYQSFFAGELLGIERIVDNEECAPPVMVDDVHSLKPSIRFLVMRARLVVARGADAPGY